MTRKRFGYANNTFTPINWQVECPIHPGVSNIEYPVASVPGTSKVEFAMDIYYCPTSGGHTFRIEDANATTFNDDGSVQSSGVPVQNLLYQY
jgi:hypothetical protein